MLSTKSLLKEITWFATSYATDSVARFLSLSYEDDVQEIIVAVEIATDARAPIDSIDSYISYFLHKYIIYCVTRLNHFKACS